MPNKVETDPIAIFTQVVENNSAISLFLIALAAVVWFGGGNLLDKSNQRRTGKSSPWYTPWKNFNTRESMTVLLLFITAMILGITGVVFAQ